MLRVPERKDAATPLYRHRGRSRGARTCDIDPWQEPAYKPPGQG